MSETLTVTLDASGHSAAGAIDRAAAAADHAASQEVIPASAVRTLTVTAVTPGDHPEGDADDSHMFRVTLSGQAYAAGTTVTWSVAHGTTEDADVVAASDREGTVSFAPSDTDGAAKTFTINIVGDNLNEVHETFTVQASVADADADGGTAFGAPASLTITDDDPLVISVAASRGTVAESAGQAMRDIVFTVSLGAELSANVDIPFRFGAAAD